MWFRQLEYPRVQSYAIPYITEFFYAISALLIVLLATLNVAIVGNDVVTELKSSPNNTDSKWWAPSWMPESLAFPTVPGPCQPFTFPQHATSIRTNSTLPIFSYTILNGLGMFQNETPTWFDSIAYSAEPLEHCAVQNITALINFQDRSHKLTSDIICNITAAKDAEIPPTMKLSTTFSRMANTDLGSDDVVDYISSYVVPHTANLRDAHSVTLVNGSSPLNMLAVLDAFGSEFLKAMWARKWSWKIGGNESWPDQGVAKWSSRPNCISPSTSRLDPERCRVDLEIGGIDSWYTNTKGSQNFNPVYLKWMNTTLFNYFIAMEDAIHLDLGTVDHGTNIFLNTTAFKHRIARDKFMNRTAPSVIGHQRPDKSPPFTPDEYWTTCTWGWGCINGTWTDALLDESPVQNISKGLPLDNFDGPRYATVIDVKYVCPVFRPKKIGQLLVSVFIGTFSMYVALYGVFAFVAPRIDEWYRKRNGIHRFSTNLEDLSHYSSLEPYPYQTPRSADPYVTIFDAADTHDYSTEAAPRYDPAINSTYPTSRKRDSTLPPGAYIPSSVPYNSASIPSAPSANPVVLAQPDEAEERNICRDYDDYENTALLPGCFESRGELGPSTSGGSARTPVPESATFVAVPAAHTVPPLDNSNGIKTGRSFMATLEAPSGDGGGVH